MLYQIGYHAGCPDGFTAAYIVSEALQLLSEEAGRTDVTRLTALDYRDPTMDAEDADRVIIVDFCPPPQELERLANEVEAVIVLDHHQTAADHLDEMSERWSTFTSFKEMAASGDMLNVVCIDQDHSGAGLAAMMVDEIGWDPNDIFPFWPEIEDRDLWRFDLPDTEDLFAAITSWPYTIETWEAIAETPRDDLLAQGRAINQYRKQLINQVTASTFPLRLGDLEIPCCSAPYAIGSDAAGRLAEESEGGIGAYAICHAGDVQIGLRSRKNGPDVARIAELWGGGGHPGASGLRLSWLQFAAAVLGIPASRSEASK